MADNVQPIRFHDLRATFTTWALRQGRGKFWLQDRTGHITDEQMARYARQARTLADLRIEPFPDISGLCDVELRMRPSTSQGFIEVFLEMRDALRDRYGKPDRMSANVPAQCVDTMQECLVDGVRGPEARWDFKSTRIELRMRAFKSEEPAVTLRFRHDEREAAPGL